ncbi:metallophosphoesterase [Paracoccus luteus]|uniref:metallophosphoesterase n=1 Tax=Paracoccus luteus TaxID=2508543 RepID=UPI0010702C07|nr:metallophosphoesterase [Paracoccus luteus]
MTRHRRTARRGPGPLGLVARLGAAAALGYALWWEPAMRLRVVRWTLSPERWRGHAPVRLVVIADLHAGAPHLGRGRVSRIVARANALKPDVAILLGDYSAAHPFTCGFTAKDEIVAVLRDFTAPLGTFAVVGNHDWWQDVRAQTDRCGPVEAECVLERHGIPVLDNKAVRLGGADGFWLAGIGDQRPFDEGPDGEGMDDLETALACVTDDDAPIVLLAHEPDIFPRLDELCDAAGRDIAVQVSGHTHGGQIRLFGGSPLIMASENETYSWGRYDEGGRSLIVSGGVGCSVLPMRVGMVPEITVIDLIPPQG